jgi:uncharacterized protein YjeT (DUF2065 family)
MQEQQQLNITKLLGLLLVAIGIVIWIISIIELASNEVMLAQNLSMDDVWRYEGALQWWENMYATAIIPATAVLIISGILIMLSPRLSKYVKKNH